MVLTHTVCRKNTSLYTPLPGCSNPHKHMIYHQLLHLGSHIYRHHRETFLGGSFTRRCIFQASSLARKILVDTRGTALQLCFCCSGIGLHRLHIASYVAPLLALSGKAHCNCLPASRHCFAISCIYSLPMLHLLLRLVWPPNNVA